MISMDKEEVKEFILNAQADIYFSDEVQDLLRGYAQDVISSKAAIHFIPKSYFKGTNIDREKEDLISIYTENRRDEIYDAVREKMSREIDKYLE